MKILDPGLMKVVELTSEHLQWSFTQEPKLRLGNHRWETVDPTPAYAHDINLVRSLSSEVYAKFPVGKAELYVAHFEGTSRTNGWADSTYDYTGNYDEEKRRYTDKIGYIFLSGKRTPIHPAMTQYLVAHEYGHLVEYFLEQQWELREGEDEIRDLYAKVRALDTPAYYGPGTWHYSPGEVFANDFRVVVAKRELEYWPHPDIDRPEGLFVEQWWKDVIADPSKERWAELQEAAE